MNLIDFDNFKIFFFKFLSLHVYSFSRVFLANVSKLPYVLTQDTED